MNKIGKPQARYMVEFHFLRQDWRGNKVCKLKVSHKQLLARSRGLENVFKRLFPSSIPKGDTCYKQLIDIIWSHRESGNALAMKLP